MEIINDKQVGRIVRKVKKSGGFSNHQIEVIVLLMFPRKDADLDVKFNNILAYLNSSATRTRLKIDPDKYDAFVALMGSSPRPDAVPPGTNGEEGTWNFVFPLEKNKATFTNPLQKEKDKLIIAIKLAVLDMFSDIPDSVITISDTSNLGIKKKSARKKRQKSPEEIIAEVHITLIPISGGMVWVICTSDKMSKRPCKLNRYVDIELAFSLIPVNANPPVLPPATSKKCSTMLTVSTAKFLLELGEDAPGFKLVLFARWVYTKHPSKSGKFGLSRYCFVS